MKRGWEEKKNWAQTKCDCRKVQHRDFLIEIQVALNVASEYIRLPNYLSDEERESTQKFYHRFENREAKKFVKTFGLFLIAFQSLAADNQTRNWIRKKIRRWRYRSYKSCVIRDEHLFWTWRTCFARLSEGGTLSWALDDGDGMLKGRCNLSLPLLGF